MPVDRILKKTGVLSGVRWVLNDLSRLIWTFVGVLLVCSLAYAGLEGKGPIEGTWWGIVTASTTGYGDYSPATTPGRFFGAVLILSSFVLLLGLGAHLNRWLMNDPDAWTDEEQKQLMADVKATRETVERTERMVQQLVTRDAAAVGSTVRQIDIP